MTKEEIEQYIDLDNKIQNRIVQITSALNGIKGSVIKRFVPKYMYVNYNVEPYYKSYFIENSNADSELHLGLSVLDDGDSSEFSIDKTLLCMTDEQINEIVEYDRKAKEKEIKRQKEAEEARRERVKKEVEEKEYEQYLRLKKKFEPEFKPNPEIQHSEIEKQLNLEANGII